jgi:hypothetical protein
MVLIPDRIIIPRAAAMFADENSVACKEDTNSREKAVVGREE